ncbi:MAG: esterase/lipase family protein, partial [Chloroflexota bacterium]
MQPIVIVGGFLSSSRLYEGMARELRLLTGQQVSIAHLEGPQWLRAMFVAGWPYLLDQVERVVYPAAVQSPTGKVTLVGHSAGGILARLFL